MQRRLLHIALVATAILCISAMDLSSYCHPAENATDLRLIGAAKAAESLDAAEAIVAIVATEAILASQDLAAIDLGEVDLSDYKELTWADLADVDFKEVFLEEIGAYYWKPEFGEKLKALEGSKVYITGYMIPVDVDEDFYVLSRYPFANCFFCGGAGPESVTDLRFADEDHRAYKTDERMTFHGSLRLNADDIMQMNYILDDAVEHPL
jgi:hypothetical protein